MTTCRSLSWSGVTARRMARQWLAEPSTDLAPAEVASALCGVDAQVLNKKTGRIASGLNRYPNATFRHGLLEELPQHFAAGSVDLVYSFAVLEHVRDVDQTIEAVLTVLRPGGRFCFVVPMKEFEANGHIPPYVPRPGYCDHVRVFTERELRDRFGRSEGFVLHALDGPLKAEKTPPFLRVLAHGSFFVAFSKAYA